MFIFFFKENKYHFHSSTYAPYPLSSCKVDNLEDTLSLFRGSTSPAGIALTPL